MVAPCWVWFSSRVFAPCGCYWSVIEVLVQPTSSGLKWIGWVHVGYGPEDPWDEGWGLTNGLGQWDSEQVNIIENYPFKGHCAPVLITFPCPVNIYWPRLGASLHVLPCKFVGWKHMNTPSFYYLKISETLPTSIWSMNTHSSYCPKILETLPTYIWSMNTHSSYCPKISETLPTYIRSEDLRAESALKVF
jgi:hypothetical protein